MSGIRNQEIKGDLSVYRDIAAGGRINANGSVKVGHSLKVEGWLDAPNIKGCIKGVFATEEELNAAYSRPQTGWIAGVGDGLPCAAYRVEGGRWVRIEGGTITANVSLDSIEADIESARTDAAVATERVGDAEQAIEEINEALAAHLGAPEVVLFDGVAPEGISIESAGAGNLPGAKLILWSAEHGQMVLQAAGRYYGTWQGDAPYKPLRGGTVYVDRRSGATYLAVDEDALALATDPNGDARRLQEQVDSKLDAADIVVLSETQWNSLAERDPAKIYMVYDED